MNVRKPVKEMRNDLRESPALPGLAHHCDARPLHLKGLAIIGADAVQHVLRP